MNLRPDLPNPISRAPGTSLHRQLFIVLRDEIMRGKYIAGALIPKEEELCEQFGVSRITVRRALADLEAQGLVEKRQGKGTFVSQALPAQRPLATIGFIESLKKVSDETQVQVLSIERINPPSEIARQLDTTPQEQLLHVMRLRTQNDTPVMLTEAWVPESYAQDIDQKTLENRALYELLIERGVKFGRVVQEITAIAASPQQAHQLKTEIGQPLMKLSRLIYDIKDKPVQYLLVLLSPHRSRILMDYSIESMDSLVAGSIFHDPSQ